MDMLLRGASEIGVTGFLDIGLMALLIYGLLVWLKRTRRAGLTLWGILILGGIYLAATRIGLVLTSMVLRAFFAVFVIMMVVIFQEELRNLFEQLARLSLKPRSRGTQHKTARLLQNEVDILTRTLGDLARTKTGALVVVKGGDPVDRHVDGGFEVQGRLSEALLKSIFDPHSLGHDGAVIVIGGLIDRLGVRLPLTRDAESLGSLGTRHAAALGLSERTDALCLVVSEERGTISAVRRGNIQLVRDPARLSELIEAFYEEVMPQARPHPWRSFLLQNFREKALALGAAVVLWFGLAYHAEVISQYYTVTVEHASVPNGLSVVRLTPSALEVQLAGPRTLLRTVQARDIRLTLSLTNVVPGFQVIPISEGEFVLPEGVSLGEFRPRQVFVDVEEVSSPDANQP